MEIKKEEDQFLKPTTPVAAFERRAAEERAEEEKPTIGEAIKASVDEDWMMSWALRDRPEYAPDPDFYLEKEDYQKAVAGLPEEYHGFVEDAVSAAHLQSLRERALQSYETDKKLGQLGWAGVGVRFGVALSDPAAIGLSVATEGVAAPMIWGNKLSRLQRAFRGGTAAASTNAIVESYLVSQNGVKDPYDVLYSASAGLLLGGALSSLGRADTTDPINDALAKMAKAADDAQKHEAVIAVNRKIVGEARIPADIQNKIDIAQNEINEIQRLLDDEDARELARIEKNKTGLGYDKRQWKETLERDLVSQKKMLETQKKKADEFAGEQFQAPTEGNPFEGPQITPLRDDLDDWLEKSGDMAQPALEKFRFDMTGFMLGSKQPTGNLMGRILAEDPVGFRADAEQVIGPTASLTKTNIFKSTLNDYYDTVNPAYNEWAKTEGFTGVTGYFKRKTNLPRRQFMELVADAVENPDAPFHPAVRRAAQKQAELKRDLLRQMKDSGVKGAENIPEDLSYFSHLWDSFKFEEAVSRYGDDVVQTLLTRALINATDELNEDAASMIAKHMLMKIRRAEAGMDSGPARLFTTEDRDAMRDILVEEGFMTKEEADQLIALFEKTPDGRPARLKRRLRFNMGESTLAVNRKTGQEEILRLKDLQERDAEQVFLSYTAGMSGRIGLAKVGIKDQTTFNQMLDRNLAEANAMFGPAGKKRAQQENLVAETLYNSIINRRAPLAADPTGNYARTARLIQDYNFLRLMNQVGFAQVGELGNAISIGGVRGILQAVPEIRAMLKRAKDGKIEDPVIRDIMAATGISADRNINQAINRADTIGVFSEGRGDFIDKALFMAAPMKRVTADISGMAQVTLMLERIAARVATQTLTDLAFKSKTLSRKRLAGLGLDDEMAERIYTQIRSKAITQKSLFFGNRKIKDINADQWDDTEARFMFFNAIARMTKRGIQQNDIGDLNLYMTSTMGQILTQFRTFMLVSWAKQFLHNIKANDLRGYQAMMGSVAFASLGYMAQVQANAQFREDKEEYLEKMLSVDAIGKAAFQRSSWASLWPALIDTGGAFFTDEPVFAYRSTGLETNLITGNPTVQLISKGLASTQAVSRSLLNPDLQFSQGQQRALNTLYPYQNALGVKNALNKLVEIRPETTRVD